MDALKKKIAPCDGPSHGLNQPAILNATDDMPIDVDLFKSVRA
jgi:hypothetical protein